MKIDEETFFLKFDSGIKEKWEPVQKKKKKKIGFGFSIAYHHTNIIFSKSFFFVLQIGMNRDNHALWLVYFSQRPPPTPEMEILGRGRSLRQTRKKTQTKWREYNIPSSHHLNWTRKKNKIKKVRARARQKTF